MHSSESGSDTPASRLATRLAFLIAGVGVACWAPLVPYVKGRIGADDAELGLLLLCLGLGSVVAMPLAAALCSRMGSRVVIIASGLLIVLTLPILALAPSIMLLAIALGCFGAAMGALDVAANIHGTEVQNAADTTLMSNFHGMYSVGGLIGAAIMTLMLVSGVSPLAASLVGSAVLLLCVSTAAPRLLRTKVAADAPFFVLPHGITILIGGLAFIMFLVEGAVLDWSAVLLSDARDVAKEQSGIGYVLFALAMSIGRLTGDRTIARFGATKVLLWGALLTTAGIGITVFSHATSVAMTGFLIIGFGAANLVPVLFTAVGLQRSMPKDFAIAAASTMGYAGVLCGPALVGFLAKAIGLSAGFGVLGAAVLLVALCAGIIGRIGDEAG